MDKSKGTVADEEFRPGFGLPISDLGHSVPGVAAGQRESGRRRQVGVSILLFPRAQRAVWFMSGHQPGWVEVDGIESPEWQVVSGTAGWRQADAGSVPAAGAGWCVPAGMDDQLGATAGVWLRQFKGSRSLVQGGGGAGHGE